MWNDEQREKHERQCRLQSRELQALPLDEYRLRTRWPLCIENLRPMSVELLRAANAVYQVVAGKDTLACEYCLSLVYIVTNVSRQQ